MCGGDAMSYASAPLPPRPISEINTTPLIDVMLVLLVMLVITIPVATHSFEIDLPKNGPVVQTTKNRVVVTRSGSVLWNGEPVDQYGLAVLLHRTTLLDPEPELQFEPEGRAGYGRSAEVLHQIEQSGVTKF